MFILFILKEIERRNEGLNSTEKFTALVREIIRLVGVCSERRSRKHIA